MTNRHLRRRRVMGLGPWRPPPRPLTFRRALPRSCLPRTVTLGGLAGAPPELVEPVRRRREHEGRAVGRLVERDVRVVDAERTRRANVLRVERRGRPRRGRRASPQQPAEKRRGQRWRWLSAFAGKHALRHRPARSLCAAYCESLKNARIWLKKARGALRRRIEGRTAALRDRPSSS